MYKTLEYKRSLQYSWNSVLYRRHEHPHVAVRDFISAGSCRPSGKGGFVDLEELTSSGFGLILAWPSVISTRPVKSSPG